MFVAFKHFCSNQVIRLSSRKSVNKYLYMYLCICVSYDVVAQSFLNGELQIPADEAFVNAVQSYFEEFLKSDRVVALVSSGGSSANDFREVRCPVPS